MKRYWFSIFLISAFLGHSQNQINGKVLRQSSNYTPVKGIFVTANDTTNGKFSDSEGLFSIKFPTKTVGDYVFPKIGKGDTNIALDKKGVEWVLINEDAMKVVSIPKDPTEQPLKIVVAPKGERDTNARKYYGILETHSEKKVAVLENEIAELIKNKGESDELVSLLREDLKIARQRLNDSLELYKSALFIANINLDGASERVRKYKLKLDNGLGLDDAIKELSPEKAEEEALKGGELERAAIEEIQTAAKAAEAQFEFDTAISLYNRITNIYKKNKREIIDIIRNLSTVGYLCADLNKDEQAIAYYEEALRLFKEKYMQSHPDRAVILSNLGVLYKNIQLYVEAENSYDEALGLSMKYAVDNPSKFEPDIARTQMNLGVLYWGQRRYLEAEVSYRESLSLYRKYAVDNLSKFEPYIALTQNNLGLLYQDQQRYSEAEASYQESLSLGRKYAVDNPSKFEPGIAKTQMNLGVLYRDQQRYSEAWELYQESLSLRRKYAVDNPSKFEPEIADTQVRLGNLYYKQKRYSEAGESYRESLSLYRKYAVDNPSQFEPEIAGTQVNLGNLYYKQKRYSEAGESYRESLSLYRKYAVKNSSKFEPDIALTQNNLGVLYQDQQRYSRAEASYREALSLRRKFAVENPSKFEPDIAQTQNNLGNLYSDQQRNSEAEASYREALSFYRKYAVENPSKFEPYIAQTQHNLGILYLDQQRYGKAEAAYLEAIKIREKWNLKYPKIYGLKLAQSKRGLVSVLDATLTIENFTTHRQRMLRLLKEAKNALVLYEGKTKEAQDYLDVLTNYEKYVRDLTK